MRWVNYVTTDQKSSMDQTLPRRITTVDATETSANMTSESRRTKLHDYSRPRSKFKYMQNATIQKCVWSNVVLAWSIRLITEGHGRFSWCRRTHYSGCTQIRVLQFACSTSVGWCSVWYIKLLQNNARWNTLQYWYWVLYRERHENIAGAESHESCLVDPTVSKLSRF